MKAQNVECKVTENIDLTSDVFQLTLDLGDSPEFKAGQFISLAIPGVGPKGRDLRRAYSIASTPEQNTLELCVAFVADGKGTPVLKNLSAGDTIQGSIPFGDFIYKTEPARHAVFVATGTGISPFRSMWNSEQVKAAPAKSTTLVFGTRTEEGLLYRGEIEKLDSLTYAPCVSREENFSGFKGRVTDYIRTNDFDWATTDFYLCGNGDMIKEVKEILTEHGVEKPAIFFEKYY